ncbi:MAG TPA: proline racemase family protein [Anaerolineales bacterium]|nr:proline racemase family protein [Anaerolineales bacterium]
MRITKMITAVDAHAAGEPGRVIVGGIVDVPGKTMLEKKTYLETHADSLRMLMLHEPRGYPALCCNILLPPTHPDADAGFVIMEQTEYPGMSGTNTICVTTVLLETGILPMKEPLTELTLEAPAGLIKVRADCENGQVKRVTFQNVPAFSVYLDTEIEVPELGTLKVDVAYGGMFYVIADATQFGLKLTPDEGREIVRISEMIRVAADEQLSVAHPEIPEFSGITISQLSGPPTHPEAHMKNAVTVATGKLDWSKPSTWTGALDRSPCGTGTCAKMATLYARGELGLNQDFRHEGLLGTIFTGRLLEETKVGGYRAVVPTLSGQAWITGLSNYVVDPDDPFPEGFTIGDIW